MQNKPTGDTGSPLQTLTGRTLKAAGVRGEGRYP